MIEIAALDLLIVGLTVPMMIYGKACRRWTLGRYRDFVQIRDAM
jgi:hypothetical protein